MNTYPTQEGSDKRNNTTIIWQGGLKIFQKIRTSMGLWFLKFVYRLQHGTHPYCVYTNNLESLRNRVRCLRVCVKKFRKSDFERLRAI